ncbi:MAG: LLM class flavin-dependent oxidoreductase, partial [Thermomicrobium sp.]
YEGRIFRVSGLTFGPAPAHPIPLWVGATRPRALRLTGALADGLTISTPYVLPERLTEVNRLVDEGAARAGRDPRSVRRLYNLLGVLDRRGSRSLRVDRPGFLSGSVEDWANAVARFAKSGMDTFIFWPIAGDYVTQARCFVEEVIPRVQTLLGQR